MIFQNINLISCPQKKKKKKKATLLFITPRFVPRMIIRSTKRIVKMVFTTNKMMLFM